MELVYRRTLSLAVNKKLFTLTLPAYTFTCTVIFKLIYKNTKFYKYLKRYATSVNVKKIYLLITVVYDGVKVLCVKMNNTAGCQTSEFNL